MLQRTTKINPSIKLVSLCKYLQVFFHRDAKYQTTVEKVTTFYTSGVFMPK